MQRFALVYYEIMENTKLKVKYYHKQDLLTK